MTLDEALDLVVSRGGVERLRWLCSADNPDQGQRDDYRRLVLSMAGGPAPPPEPETEPIPEDPDTARIRDCPDYNPACCSNPAPFCTRFLISPTREQCLKCLRDEDWERFSLLP